MSDISNDKIQEHLDRLVKIGIVKKHDNGDKPATYSLNPDVTTLNPFKPVK